MLRESRRQLSVQAIPAELEWPSNVLGRVWRDPGMKSAVGIPSIRLQFVGKSEERTLNVQGLTLSHKDSKFSLRAESVYEAFPKAGDTRAFNSRVESARFITHRQNL